MAVSLTLFFAVTILASMTAHGAEQQAGPAPGVRERQDTVVQSARQADAGHGPRARPFRRRNGTLDWAELGMNRNSSTLQEDSEPCSHDLDQGLCEISAQNSTRAHRFQSRG
ncbi:hypothetical protein N9B54_03830 [Mariniblastus sp.]|nr:hypothetical protein [Mariniblastus sp.]